MNLIARLSYQGGGAILPAHTFRERRRLVRCVEQSAQQYGLIRLALGSQRWTIRVGDRLHRVCRACSKWPHDLACPGGSDGGFCVISSLARPCTDVACELAT